MFSRKPKRRYGNVDDTTLASIRIQRRRGQKYKSSQGTMFVPAGWDLMDGYSGRVIAEFNDETAPPTMATTVRSMSTSSRISSAYRDNGANNGSELGEMFQEIYRLCYQNTMDAMKMIAAALPEHEETPHGGFIASLEFKVNVSMPETSALTKKQAYQQGFNDPF
jgi:hypothetical protein